MELPSEYSEYSNIFSNSGTTELPEYGPIDYAIDLIDKR